VAGEIEAQAGAVGHHAVDPQSNGPPGDAAAEAVGSQALPAQAAADAGIGTARDHGPPRDGRPQDLGPADAAAMAQPQ